jgi:predicted transposase YbfD/YdcC
MDVDATRGLLRAFAQLEDPRMDRTRLHSLTDILTIAICATICGADGWPDVVLFGRAKEKWFRTFLDLPNGIPSHDTFRRVFMLLKPDAFERCFMTWMDELANASAGRLIAVDGKTIRRSLDAAGGKAAIHMVSAWCNANEMVLGQLAVDEKSNEITAIPTLLELIDIDGAVVTIDAMGCQKEIAKTIVEGKGDYVLQLKGNQGGLHGETVELFEQCLRDDCLGMAYTTATVHNKGHGRIEQRTIWATEDVSWFTERKKWANLRSLIRVQRQRTIAGETSSEYHYYISSLPAEKPETLLAYIRGHWSVENKLHWSLDITFADDDRRHRRGYAAENASRLSRLALNLLKAEKTEKASLRAKRKLCGWDHNYLLKVLTGPPRKNLDA